MRLVDRLTRLELAHNTQPPLMLEIDRRPTDAQQCDIDAAIRAGRRTLVFVGHGDTLWMPGAGPAPWMDDDDEH